MYCQVRSFEKLLEKHDFTGQQKNELTREFLRWLSQISDSPKIPELGREIHAKIRKVLGTDDPYLNEKEKANQYLLSRYSEFRQLIDRSEDPFQTAMKLAIAGNIIDFGPGRDFNIQETIDKVLQTPLKIDHSGQLKRAVQNARNILYLGDNAGEIVMDKLFLETIGHPQVYFAVRGRPVINDATEKDANFVKMGELAKVISNGYDAPSTIVSKSSQKFRDLYGNADLIIAKGMGNLEGLLDENQKEIFFLLMVKCQVIGDKIGAKTGDIVALRNDFAREAVSGFMR